MDEGGDVGTVVARRALRGPGGSLAAEVTIGAPRRESDRVWYCPYTISGIGLTGVQKAHGVDAVQALVMALEAIRTVLARHETPWRWEGGEEGDSGFPQIVPVLYGLDFAKKLERVIEREVEEFARNARDQYSRPK